MLLNVMNVSLVVAIGRQGPDEHSAFATTHLVRRTLGYQEDLLTAVQAIVFHEYWQTPITAR